MNVKSFFWEFALSVFLAKVIVALIIAYQATKLNFFSAFIILALSWSGITFLMHVFLFGIYYILVDGLIMHIKKESRLYISLGALATGYLAITIMTDWTFSQDLFKRFNDYLYRGTYYPIYALVIVIVVTTKALSTLYDEKRKIEDLDL